MGRLWGRWGLKVNTSLEMEDEELICSPPVTDDLETFKFIGQVSVIKKFILYFKVYQKNYFLLMFRTKYC